MPKIRMIRTAEDNYVGFNNYLTLQREYYFTPDGEPLRGDWVLRDEGKFIEANKCIDDLADRFNLILG